MQKFVGAAIHLKENKGRFLMKKVEILCGTDSVVKIPLSPYNDRVCEFLDVWSKELRKDEEAKKYADLQTFAFWIRKSNIQKKKRGVQ